MATADGPRFEHTAPVHFDELDAMRMLHNARFFVHMERAASAFYRSIGARWEENVADNPDQFHVVKVQEIEYVVPFMGTGELRVEMHVERYGRTSCTLAFRFTSPDSATTYARGTRTIVKLNPATLRPIAWTDRFRAALAALMRDTEVIHADI
jgi:acyl-CoA thioester hydrolase